jgi:hypothetical protein
MEELHAIPTRVGHDDEATHRTGCGVDGASHLELDPAAAELVAGPIEGDLVCEFKTQIGDSGFVSWMDGNPPLALIHLEVHSAVLGCARITGS